MTFDLAQMIADREAGTPGDKWVTMNWQTAKDDQVRADMRRENNVPLLEAEIIRLTARVAALEDALDPNLTKADYIGEVKTDFVQAVEDEDGDIIDQTHEVMISWTAMKQFMAMISARAALSTHTEEPKT